MLLNYLKVAIRNLIRNKFYSFINIFGLTVGITATMLIVLFVNDELSYDRFHTNSDRIYRVGVKGILSGAEFNMATSCSPMASALVAEFPEVESAIRITQFTNVVLKNEEDVFTEPKMLLADSNFFEFFTFELIEGDMKTALKGPNQIVLTEAAALKYFGYDGKNQESPIGMILNVFTSGRACKITGIAKDPPKNSHFIFEVILSMPSWSASQSTQWTSNNLYTYFTIREDADIENTKLKFNGLVEKYVGPEIEQFLGMSLSEFKNGGGDYGYVVEPLTDIHLKSTLGDQIEPGGNITYLYIFTAIAVFIIFIAAINFMNLSTARSSNRAKEVGVRKTVGALRSGLMVQFLAESIFLSMISMVLALALIYLVLDGFNQISAKTLTFNPIDNFWLPGGIFMVSFFTGLISGIYPAVYLTSFRPVEVLKGKLRAGLKSSGIRNVLVVFQFTISIILIICTTVVFRQLIHMQNKNLGLNKENVLVIDNARGLGSNFNAFIDNLKTYPEFLNVSSSNQLPPNIFNNSTFRPVGDKETDHLIYFYSADYDHLKTIGMEMANGRFFSRDFPSDSNAIVLNQAAMRQIGWEDHESRQIFTFNNSMDDPPMDVIGVVRDFNFETLKNEIKPLAIILSPQSNLISIKLASGNLQDRIKLVEDKWKVFAPNAPFEYTFLDQDFAALFKTEQQLGKIFTIFTVLGIFIACLGLFGLSTFAAEQRAKEISIRKVMGASLGSIMTLLTKDFTKLVGISFLISIPLAYYSMSLWLDGFAYKVEIGVITIIASGLSALLITWITVSYQSFKAGNASPVNSLRSE